MTQGAGKLLMFDFDGVIADSWRAQKQAYVDIARAHGLHDLATSAAFRALMDTNWFEGLKKSGLPAHVIAEMDERWSCLTPELFPGMPEVLERLARTHVVLVITSAYTADVRRTLEVHGVKGVSDVLGGDGEPSKELKIRAAQVRYGEWLQPRYICDTTGDVVEARAAGCAVIGTAWGWHGEERLRVADPDRIARQPTDLLDLL